MAPSLAGTLAAAALETLLRGLLAADPATRAELAAFAGKRLAITPRGGPLTLTLAFTAEGIRVDAADAADADAEVELAPAALVDVLGGDLERTVMAGHVQVRGDAQFATQAFMALSRFAPDLEGPLGRLVGEAPAAAFGTAARRGTRTVRETAELSGNAVRDLLTDPQGPLPSRPEVARFLDEVDDLRLATDRAAARLEALRARRETAAGDPSP